MRVDIDNLPTLPVAIFVYKQCLFISVTWSGETCVRFVYGVSFVRSFLVSFVRISFRAFVYLNWRTKRMIHESNDARNERTNYTNETERNRKTQNEWTIDANETNEKRKRYEIYVNINDPGSVYCIEPHCCYLHEIWINYDNYFVYCFYFLCYLSFLFLCNALKIYFLLF